METGQLAGILVRITQLLRGGEKNIDQILDELKVKDVESAIFLLESEQKLYFSKNFHPISAKIASILVFLYSLNGSAKKCILSILFCLSPYNIKYMEEFVWDIFGKVFNSVDPVVVDVRGDLTPFECRAGFVKQNLIAGQSPELILSFKTNLKANTKIDSVQVLITHPDSGNASFEMMKDVILISEFPIKKVSKVGPFPPGSVSIKSVVAKIDRVQIVISDFGCIGFREAVLPFEIMCNFDALVPKFGVIGCPYSFTIFCNNISERAISKKINVSVSNNKDLFSFFDTDDSVIIIKTDDPRDQEETPVKLIVHRECTLDFSLNVEVSYGVLSSKWQRRYQVEFYDAFISSFSIINSDYHFDAKLPREILQVGQQSFLVANFVCKCPGTIIVKDLKINSNEGFVVTDTSEVFPIQLNTKDEFTASSFIVSSSCTNSCSIGSLCLIFDDEFRSGMKYVIDLPEVCVVDKVVDVKLDMMNEIEEKTMYALKVSARALKSQFPVEIIIGNSEEFLFDGETNRRVHLTKDMEVLASINFMALRTGSLSFPTISFLFVSDHSSTIIWQNSPSIFVKYKHASPKQ